MDLIDSHAHVDVSDFDADREAMLARAQAAGVGTLLAIGNGPEIEKLGAAVPYAEAARLDLCGDGNSSARGAARDAGRIMPNWSGWRGILELSPGAKLGSTITTIIRRATCRHKYFAEQLELSARGPQADHHSLPGSLARLPENSRSGLAKLRPWRHFSLLCGTVEEARFGMDMGFLVSFAGNVTYPKAQNLRDAATAIPLDRLLIETDSPFLAPQPHRGRRNEPATSRKWREPSGM